MGHNSAVNTGVWFGAGRGVDYQGRNGRLRLRPSAVVWAYWYEVIDIELLADCLEPEYVLL